MKKKRILTTLACTLLLCGGMPAQTDTAPRPVLKGKVVDRGGETVIGAHVKWKGDKLGAVTDIDGTFSIPETGTELVISFLGYKTQTIKIRPGQKNLIVTLEDDAQDLDELVVVGYGTQKKAALTGSIETIKREDLLSLPTANLDEALYGQVAGLQVMQTTGDPSSAKEADLHIRGINNTPLLVIDGVPRFGTSTSDGEMRLSDLNPDDIESISILKDAAAAAVYGARAANGVILVQTKRAEGNQKISVNYRGQINIQQAAQLGKLWGVPKSPAQLPGPTQIGLFFGLLCPFHSAAPFERIISRSLGWRNGGCESIGAAFSWLSKALVLFPTSC